MWEKTAGVELYFSDSKKTRILVVKDLVVVQLDLGVSSSAYWAYYAALFNSSILRPIPIVCRWHMS